MSIFTSREAAEEFAAGDPFVLNGVIRNWQIREWDEVLAPATPADTTLRSGPAPPRSEVVATPEAPERLSLAL